MLHSSAVYCSLVDSSTECYIPDIFIHDTVVNKIGCVFWPGAKFYSHERGGHICCEIFVAWSVNTLISSFSVVSLCVPFLFLSLFLFTPSKHFQGQEETLTLEEHAVVGASLYRIWRFSLPYLLKKDQEKEKNIPMVSVHRTAYRGQPRVCHSGTLYTYQIPPVCWFLSNTVTSNPAATRWAVETTPLIPAPITATRRT